MRELPGALQPDDRHAGAGCERFATLLGPTAEKLRPAARALAPANEAIRPLASEATPLLRDDIRPFVREARPVARDLRPAAHNLADGHARPDALVRARSTTSSTCSRFNPNGREGPGNAARQEGYLFWLALGAAHGDAAVLDLGRPRHVPPGHGRRAVRHDPSSSSRSSPSSSSCTMLTPILTDSEACATG